MQIMKESPHLAWSLFFVQRTMVRESAEFCNVQTELPQLPAEGRPAPERCVCVHVRVHICTCVLCACVLCMCVYVVCVDVEMRVYVYACTLLYVYICTQLHA